MPSRISPPDAAPRPERLSQRAWLALMIAATLLLCGLPYVVSALSGPPDLERIGTFWFVRDYPQYLAAMREGEASASWLIHDRFTAEPHAPVLMYPLYVALGKLAALTRTDSQAWFAASEWLGRVALVLSIWWFGASWLPALKARRLAFLLTVGTLGLAGWAVPWWLVFGAQGEVPSANIFLEMNSFGVFFAAPHIMLGLALTLCAAPLYLRAVEAGPSSQRWTVLLAVDLLVLSAIHPFNLPVLLSVLLIDALLRARRGERRPLLVAGAALIGGLPLGLYNAVLFQLDPFWAETYGRQNSMPAPAPWQLPVDFGLVLLAAPFGWAALRRAGPDNQRLLLLWIALGLLWLYAPVPYQRRFAFGVQPALAVMASLGLLAMNDWMRSLQWGGLRRRLVNYGLTLAAVMTFLVAYVSLIASAAFNAPVPVYLWTRNEADAARWLAPRTDSEDVVLASGALSNPLVGVFDGRVVYAHPVATRRSAEKAPLVERFYSSQASPAERQAILRDSRVTVVAWGPRERRLGTADPGDLPGLTAIYDVGGVRWYRVVGTP